MYLVDYLPFQIRDQMVVRVKMSGQCAFLLVTEFIRIFTEGSDSAFMLRNSDLNGAGGLAHVCQATWAFDDVYHVFALACKAPFNGDF